MRLNKLIALMLCLVLALGCFASCETPDDSTPQTPNADDQITDDQTPSEDEGNDDPKEEIPLDKYMVISNITFTSDDADMKKLAHAMSSTVKIQVNGENLAISQSSSTDNVSVVKSYTLVDGILYHSTGVSTDDLSAYVYEKTEMGENKKNALLSSFGSGAQISIQDFKTHNLSMADGKYIYACSDMTPEAKASLSAIFYAAFDSYDAIVDIESAEYSVTVDGERSEKSTLSCIFKITMNGNEYSLTMKIASTYAYTSNINISIPKDADKYVEVSYSDIVG